MKDSRKPGKARETSSQVSRAPGGAPGYGESYMQGNTYTFLGSGQWSSWLVRGLERKSLEVQGQEGLGRGTWMVILGVGTK